MAILKNYSVKILVDDQPLQEYMGDGEREDENPDEVVQHIQATSGAEFAIESSVNNMSGETADGVFYQFYLDGKYANGVTLCRKNPRQNLWQSDTIMRGVRGVGSEGDWQLRPFLFSQVKTVDGPTSLPFDSSVLDEIGTIKIKIFRVNITNFNANIPPQSLIRGLSKVTEVTEDKLKGMPVTHVCKLGRTTKINPFPFYQWDYVDAETSPHATFIFKYCSKKALQDILLLPRSPSPVPLEQRPVEELSLQQLQDIVRQQQVRNKAIKLDVNLTPVKRERDAEYEETLESAHVKRVNPIADGEIIDLSD